MATKPKIDYGLIEDDWRAGIKSVKQIAFEYGKNTGIEVSDRAITKHFEKLKVPRDLSAKINERANAMVRAAMVPVMVPAVTNPTDAQIIEVNAAFQAGVLVSHRKDISWFRNMLLKLIKEVEVETDNPESFAELAQVIIWKSGENGEVQTKDEVNRMVSMQQLFDRVMSSPQRIDSMKKLADTLKTLIGLERQAIGLKEDEVPKAPGTDAGVITRIERVIVRHEKILVRPA